MDVMKHARLARRLAPELQPRMRHWPPLVEVVGAGGLSTDASARSTLFTGSLRQRPAGGQRRPFSQAIEAPSTFHCGALAAQLVGDHVPGPATMEKYVMEQLSMGSERGPGY